MVNLNHSPAQSLEKFFLLALMALFAGASILVITIGARQYQSIADTMTENYETRTAASYLIEKFHQNDSSGSVEIVTLGSSDAIAFRQTVNDQEYITYIYANQGFLREITVMAGTDISPGDGQKIVESKGLSAEACSGNLYHLTLTGTDGTDYSLYLSMNAK